MDAKVLDGTIESITKYGTLAGRMAREIKEARIRITKLEKVVEAARTVETFDSTEYPDFVNAQAGYRDAVRQIAEHLQEALADLDKEEG